MYDQTPGVLLFHFAVTILLTAAASRIILAWYRQSVTRSMGLAGSAPAEADPWLGLAFAAPRHRTLAGSGASAAGEARLFELQQLVEQDLLQRTVFVVDVTTDTKLLESVLAAEGRKGTDGRAQPGLNLIQTQSGSAADSDKDYGALRALVPA